MDGGNAVSRNKKRIPVRINGQTYTILGSEGDDHIEKVAEVVDNKMRELSKRHPSLDSVGLAILTAVNTVNDYMLLQQQYQELLQSKKEEE